jgi:hypothetical protein
MDIAGKDHGLVGVNRPTTQGGRLTEPHAHRSAVVDQDFVDGSAGANHRPLVHCTPENRVKVRVHAAAGGTDPAQVGQRQQVHRQDRRDRHAFPVTGGPRSPSREGHRGLELLGLQVLVHDVEHRSLAQLGRPNLGLVLLVHLHVRRVLIGDFDVGRMWRTPKRRAHELLGVVGLAHHPGQRGPTQLVLGGDRPPPVRTGHAYGVHHQRIDRVPIHAEAVLVQLELLETRSGRRVHQRGVRIVANARQRFHTLAGTAGFGALLQNADAQSAFGEVRRGGHPVGTTPHDDNVEPLISRHVSAPFSEIPQNFQRSSETPTGRIPDL